MKNPATIVFLRKRSSEQRGIHAGGLPPCSLAYLPEWYAEAEYRGWYRSGEGQTEHKARIAASFNAMSAYLTDADRHGIMDPETKKELAYLAVERMKA